MLRTDVSCKVLKSPCSHDPLCKLPLLPEECSQGNRKVKFPLGSKAVKVLQRMIGDRTESYVFINPRTGTRYKSINKTFDRTVRRLGLTVNGTKLRFHDLRHVFATWLHSGGVSLDSLRTLLGHKDRITTNRYISQDRIAIGKELRVLPNIREAGQRKNVPNRLIAQGHFPHFYKNMQGLIMTTCFSCK